MRWLAGTLALLFGLLLGGCDAGYDNNDIELAVVYRAKSVCSCLWVMERDLDHCMAWTKASPNVAEIDVDYDERVVTAHALLMWQSRARWVDERYGCVTMDD